MEVDMSVRGVRGAAMTGPKLRSQNAVAEFFQDIGTLARHPVYIILLLGNAVYTGGTLPLPPAQSMCHQGCLLHAYASD